MQTLRLQLPKSYSPLTSDKGSQLSKAMQLISIWDPLIQAEGEERGWNTTEGIYQTTALYIINKEKTSLRETDIRNVEISAVKILTSRPPARRSLKVAILLLGFTAGEFAEYK